MDPHKNVSSHGGCVIRPLLVAHADVMGFSCHIHRISPALQFIPMLQGYDQVQFVLIQTGYAAGGSGTYPWLGFRGAGTDGFLSAVAMTLMTGIDNDDFPTRLLRHAGIPGAVFQQFS